MLLNNVWLPCRFRKNLLIYGSTVELITAEKHAILSNLMMEELGNY